MTRRAHEVQIGRHSSPHDRIMFPTIDAFSDERQQKTNYDKLLTGVRGVREGRGSVGWAGVVVGRSGCVGCAGWCRCRSYGGVRCAGTDRWAGLG